MFYVYVMIFPLKFMLYDFFFLHIIAFQIDLIHYTLWNWINVRNKIVRVSLSNNSVVLSADFSRILVLWPLFIRVTTDPLWVFVCKHWNFYFFHFILIRERAIFFKIPLLATTVNQNSSYPWDKDIPCRISFRYF